MQSDEYRYITHRLGLTQKEVALFLGVGLRTANGYANGNNIPKSCSLLLRMTLRLGLDVAALERMAGDYRSKLR